MSRVVPKLAGVVTCIPADVLVNTGQKTLLDTHLQLDSGEETESM